MPRIRGLSKEAAAPEVRTVFEAQKRQHGAPLNTTPVYALRPSILLGVRALGRGISESGGSCALPWVQDVVDQAMADLYG